MPAAQSRVSARAAPSLPTSWVEEKSTLSARRLKKSGNEKPPSQAVPKGDIWRALQGQPHRSSDTKVFLTYYPFQTGPHSAAEADLRLKLFLPITGIIGMLLPHGTDSFSINLKRSTKSELLPDMQDYPHGSWRLSMMGSIMPTAWPGVAQTQHLCHCTEALRIQTRFEGNKV